MMIRLRHLVLGGLAVALLALAFASAGLVNVGASSGHWSVTNVVLHWVMQSSVRTGALFVERPDDLDDPRLVRRAAPHFEASCAFCHGSPARPVQVLAGRMTPPPPSLASSAFHWTPEELFWIVRHGIKFSGMPSWISQERDDEVWAMVAFLRRLPALDADAYSALLEPPTHTALPGAAAAPLARCTACHGADGGSNAGAFPVIGGQSEVYLRETLRAFLDGRRESGVMAYAVTGLTGPEIDALAAHYAAATPRSPTGPATGDAQRGRALAVAGWPQARIPACESCHGASNANPMIPSLASQDAGYLAAQLRLWRDGRRGGTDHARLMEHVVPGLEDSDIADLAAFYSQLPPRR